MSKAVVTPQEMTRTFKQQVENTKEIENGYSKYYRIILCLFCVSLIALYYCYFLIQGFSTWEPMNNSIHRKQKTTDVRINVSKIQMNLTSPFLTVNKVIIKQKSSPEQDSGHAGNVYAGIKSGLVHSASSITKKTITNEVSGLLTVSKNISKQDRRHIEQILRDSINNRHMKNFIKPQNETCKRQFPLCIVIGVYKSGTRELVDFLQLHPHIQIYPSTNKCYEMKYFSEAYERGEQWFKRQMPCVYSNQITLMKHAGYFHNTGVPERIKNFNESIKLILMIREPVARAVSHYRFRKTRYQEMKRYTNQYVSKNFSWFVINANSSAVVKNNDFVRYSVYDEPMMQWLKYFNLSQFLILDAAEFKQNPVSVLKKVEGFLGLGHYITPDMFVFKKDKGFYCVQSNFTDTGSACYSENRGNKEHITVPQSTIVKLKEYFKPKSEKFFEIIGKSFNWR